MDMPYDFTVQRLNDLRTVQPNMMDMAASMMTRDAHNHAPEMATWKKPPHKPVTYQQPLDVNQIIK